MKPKKNVEQGAVANHLGRIFGGVFSNYNINLFVHHRSPLGGGYARTFAQELNI